MNNIINNSKTTMYCKVNFEIDGIDYFIEKRGKKNLRTGHVKRIMLIFILLMIVVNK